MYCADLYTCCPASAHLRRDSLTFRKSLPAKLVSHYETKLGLYVVIFKIWSLFVLFISAAREHKRT